MNTDILTDGAIKPEFIEKIIEAKEFYTNNGAYSIFLGQIRSDVIDGNMVQGIDYHAYNEMVVSEMSKMEKEILEEFPDVNDIHVNHSTGLVKVGQISLFVLIGGGHRKQAILACSVLVEKIKERFPVWKKELFEDETFHWRENEKL
jgi:molybdopterin synthase catalytic subunit